MTNRVSEASKRRLLIYTIGDESTPSTRFRVYTFIDLFKESFNTSVKRGRPQIKDLRGHKPDYIVFQKVLPGIFFLLLNKLSRSQAITVYDLDDNIWVPSHREWSPYTYLRMNLRRKLLSHYIDHIVVANEKLAAYFPSEKVTLLRMAVPCLGTVPRKRFDVQVIGSRLMKIGCAIHPQSWYQLTDLETDLIELSKICDLHIFSGRRPPLNFSYTYWEFSTELEKTFFDAMDLGLVPSTNSEFDDCKTPIKILLHFRSGSPVLTNAIALMRQGFSHDRGLIFFTKGGLCNVLKRYMDNPADLNRLGHEARLYVAERHSVERGWNQWMKILT